MRIALGLLAALVFGCSPGESKDDASDAEQKCDELVDSWCGRGTDCLISGGVTRASEREQAIARCRSDATSVLPCARAVSVDPAYGSCMFDINSMPCKAFVDATTAGAPLSLPADCTGVINLR